MIQFAFWKVTLTSLVNGRMGWEDQLRAYGSSSGLGWLSLQLGQ